MVILIRPLNREVFSFINNLKGQGMKLALVQFVYTFDSGKKNGDQLFTVRARVSYGDESYEVVGFSSESSGIATWAAFIDLCKSLELNVGKLCRMEVNGTSSQPIVTLEYDGKKHSGFTEEDDVLTRAYFKALISAISNVVPDKAAA